MLLQPATDPQANSRLDTTQAVAGAVSTKCPSQGTEPTAKRPPKAPAKTPSKTPVYFAALILFAPAIWPIVQADRFHLDDLGRARTGYLGWTSQGRPLSNLLVETLNFGTPISDLSPLPQMLALLLLAYLALTVGRKFNVPGIWRAPLIAAPLVANPFFLENLSFKFDVLPMTLATALSCMAITAIPRTKWFGLLGSLALLASLCLYQPALNVFLVFVVAELVMGQRDVLPVSELLKTFGTRCAQLLFALLAYGPVAAATVKGGYELAHASIAPIGELAHTLPRNLQAFWRYVLDSLPGLWAKPMFAFVIVGVPIGVFWSLRYTVLQWRNATPTVRLAMVAAIPLLPAALILAPWGPMLALQTPVFAPRVMIGIGALGAVGLLFVWTALQGIRIRAAWQVAVLALPVYGLVTFCCVYGVALKLQKDFENRVAAQLSDDLDSIAARHAISAYMLRGSLGYPVGVAHTIKKYPLLARLVRVYLTEGEGWAVDELRHFGVDMPQARTGAANTAPAVAMSRHYRIYLDGDVAVIAFTATH